MAKEWLKAQQHEKDYYYSGKNKQWQTPHSLEYWLNFLQIDKLKGKGLEVGCGPNGLYNFTEKVIGLDPINYHKKNFIQGVAESLPFKSKINFVICCNSLDHCQNPEKVIDEMFKISGTLILWSNIYPHFVGKIMNKTDKIHPYHFTEDDLEQLLPPSICIKRVKKSLFDWHGKNATLKGKFKLFVASLLGIKGMCLHVRLIT